MLIQAGHLTRHLGFSLNPNLSSGIHLAKRNVSGLNLCVYACQSHVVFIDFQVSLFVSSKTPYNTHARKHILIQTLNPSTLSNDDFLILSGAVQKTVWLPMSFNDNMPTAYTLKHVHYSMSDYKKTKTIFSMNSSGFLYLHKTAGAPDAAAEVRFRVTQDSDPKSFATRNDLIFNGVPWSKPMVRLFLSCYDHLLSHEGLLSREIEEIRQCLQFMQRVPVVSAMRQPFLLESATHSKHIEIIGIENGETKLEYLTVLRVQDHWLVRADKDKSTCIFVYLSPLEV